MLDFLSEKWSVEGIDLGLSDEDAKAGELDLEKRLESKEISFGERFPASEAEMAHHSRWNLMRYILKNAIYVDYFTGIHGLGKLVASVQPVDPASYDEVLGEIVPVEVRHLFVLDFDNLTSEMPPLFAVHGLADTAVPFEDSDKLAEKAKALKVLTKYWRLEGLDHEFDFDFTDLEIGEDVVFEDVGKRAIKELLKGLDNVIGTLDV